MPGPQDRWDRREDLPDRTMDLPRITDPYPAGRPDGDVPPHAPPQRGHAPTGRRPKDRDLTPAPRRGLAPGPARARHPTDRWFASAS